MEWLGVGKETFVEDWIFSLPTDGYLLCWKLMELAEIKSLLVHKMGSWKENI